MKLATVGVYDLGSESVVLMLRSGTGADFSTRSGTPKDKACIWVGADQEQWGAVVSSLLHEAKEFTEMRMGCRWTPDIDYARDAAGYMFLETHAQHSEVCARVGYFLSNCLPSLASVWNKWKKRCKADEKKKGQ